MSSGGNLGAKLLGAVTERSQLSNINTGFVESGEENVGARSDSV